MLAVVSLHLQPFRTFRLRLLFVVSYCSASHFLYVPSSCLFRLTTSCVFLVAQLGVESSSDASVCFFCRACFVWTVAAGFGILKNPNASGSAFFVCFRFLLVYVCARTPCEATVMAARLRCVWCAYALAACFGIK